eukprot:4974751-Pleurochrysis_carterae.AAC.1
MEGNAAVTSLPFEKRVFVPLIRSLSPTTPQGERVGLDVPRSEDFADELTYRATGGRRTSRAQRIAASRHFLLFRSAPLHLQERLCTDADARRAERQVPRHRLAQPQGLRLAVFSHHGRAGEGARNDCTRRREEEKGGERVRRPYTGELLDDSRRAWRAFGLFAGFEPRGARWGASRSCMSERISRGRTRV